MILWASVANGDAVASDSEGLLCKGATIDNEGLSQFVPSNSDTSLRRYDRCSGGLKAKMNMI